MSIANQGVSKLYGCAPGVDKCPQLVERELRRIMHEQFLASRRSRAQRHRLRRKEEHIAVRDGHDLWYQIVKVSQERRMAQAECCAAVAGDKSLSD